MADRTFIVYDEIKDTLDEMTDEEIGKLFRGMVDYHVTGKEPDLKGGLKFAFIPIRQQMDRDDEKWNKTREARAEAGRKGGAPKGNQNAQKDEENKQKQTKQANGCFASEKQTKQAVNVNVNEDVDVNVNVDVSGKENDKKKSAKRFSPPTIDEIMGYCKERNNRVDPERFYNFYESKGWMVGKNKMKDWKAAIRSWEQRDGPTKPHGRLDWIDEI